MTGRIRDPNPAEERFRTAKTLPSGRTIFVVYTHWFATGGHICAP